MRNFILFIILFTSSFSNAQNYISYSSGNTQDTMVQASGGICLMGGATENDEAMKWFLQRANGGDVVILRASGSDGYNDYFHEELGIALNSVETIVFLNENAAVEAYIHNRINEAEAVWIAGGNQWNYVDYWRNNSIDSLLNEGINNRQMVIGGTSAGMAIQGGFYFSAQNGTVSSATALNNPYATTMTVDSADFLNNTYLADVITDTHFDNPDRKGRTTAFLGRIFQDYGVSAKAIACDEYTAVCIDPAGKAYVYGEYPEYEDNAYFIQVNCELSDASPETISSGEALDWNRNGEALKVYQIQGTLAGDKFFDLNDWTTGSGGTWLHWSVDQGTFNEVSGSEVNCMLSSTASSNEFSIECFPNPVDDYVVIASNDTPIIQVNILNTYSQVLRTQKISGNRTLVDCADLAPGIYYLEIETSRGRTVRKLLKP